MATAIIASFLCGGVQGIARAGEITIVEGFDRGSNTGDWTWGAGDTFPTNGGNPGWYLRTDNLDTFAPQPRTQANDSVFTGDMRANGVTAVGVDLITFDTDFGAGGRPLTLMLIHDNGTPGNILDDTAAYMLHQQNVPLEGQGWRSYSFDAPSAELELPTGWKLLNMGDLGAEPNHTWDEVIQNVAQMQFFYGDPEFFFIFQQWDLGMDNVSVTMDDGGAGVDGDLDGDGVVGTGDLVILLGAWGACDDCGVCDADLDDDCMVGSTDLIILLGNWG